MSYNTALQLAEAIVDHSNEDCASQNSFPPSYSQASGKEFAFGIEAKSRHSLFWSNSIASQHRAKAKLETEARKLKHTDTAYGTLLAVMLLFQSAKRVGDM